MQTSEFDMALGERIRKAREEAGLSQQILADFINSTQNAISQYESGTRSVSLETLVRIARQLEKPLGYFLDCHGDVVVVKDTKLHEIVARIQENPEEMGLLYELWEYLKWRRSR
jgi:transcriptional regulator with XRE-family HTH domain